MPEPIDRRRERRQGDRRESPRFVALFAVMTEGNLEAVSGELGVGGASFRTRSPPQLDRLSLALDLEGRTLRVEAQVVGRKPEADRQFTHLRVRFIELAAPDELALARWVDDQLMKATSQP